MENETKELVLLPQLSEVVVSSKVELTKAQSYALAFSPFMEKVNELSKALTLMDKNNPSEIDVKTARINRLALVKVRTGSDSEKDARKADLLVETRLIDSLNNVIKNASQLTESEYSAIEKHAENLERERKENLRKERLELISEFTDQSELYALGDMTVEGFNELLSGLKLAKEAKIEAERKAEEERIEREKAEAQERERIRLENEKLKAEAIENERLAKIEREKQAVALAKIEAEKKAEQERHDKLIEAQRKEAEKLKAEADAKLKKEREENERLAAELQAKKNAELAEKAKIEKERIGKIEAEKKAAKAPDKEKLKSFVNSFQIPSQPSGLGKDAIIMESLIIEKFNAFKKWAETQIENI